MAPQTVSADPPLRRGHVLLWCPLAKEKSNLGHLVFVVPPVVPPKLCPRSCR